MGIFEGKEGGKEGCMRCCLRRREGSWRRGGWRCLLRLWWRGGGNEHWKMNRRQMERERATYTIQRKKIKLTTSWTVPLLSSPSSSSSSSSLYSFQLRPNLLAFLSRPPSFPPSLPSSLPPLAPWHRLPLPRQQAKRVDDPPSFDILRPLKHLPTPES